MAALLVRNASAAGLLEVFPAAVVCGNCPLHTACADGNGTGPQVCVPQYDPPVAPCWASAHTTCDELRWATICASVSGVLAYTYAVATAGV